jgi:RNA polymerase sigma factor (sigma-70 family)
VALPPFQRFVDAHAGEVRRFLAASVGPTDADDALQETMIAALRAYPALPAFTNLRAWVFTIAHRKAIDLHRARARRPVAVGGVPESVPADAAATPGLAREDAEPELWAAVRGLPPKMRAAVTLRFAVDLSHAEIAAVLDCSEAAARRSLHEVLKRLRETWAHA